MPITKRQFELEIDQKTEEWMKSIHAFLAQHKDEAFTEREIRDQFSSVIEESLPDEKKRYVERTRHIQDVFDFLSEEKVAFQLALEKLAGLGAVGKAIIRGSAYYAYRADFPNIDGR